MRSAETLEGQCRLVKEGWGNVEEWRGEGLVKKALQAAGLVVIKQPSSKGEPMNKSANPSIRGTCLNLS